MIDFSQLIGKISIGFISRDVAMLDHHLIVESVSIIDCLTREKSELSTNAMTWDDCWRRYEGEADSRMFSVWHCSRCECRKGLLEQWHVPLSELLMPNGCGVSGAQPAPEVVKVGGAEA